MVQDAQKEEAQAYFSQWGPVSCCQLAHNDSSLIALISQQGRAQVSVHQCLVMCLPWDADSM